jgi:hypothetical protein
MTTHTDQERFEYIALNCKSLCVNEWLVQAIVNDEWFTAYFKVPPSGLVPSVMHEDRTTAIRFVVDTMIDSGVVKAEKGNKKKAESE